MQVMDPLWLLNPGQTSPEVQNSISDPTKWTDVLQFLKKKQCSIQILPHELEGEIILSLRQRGGVRNGRY